MSTEAVSPSDRENTRRSGAQLLSEVLQRLADVTQERAGDSMGVSGSTVSRLKDDLEKVCHLLAALGFQFAPTDAMVVSQTEIKAYKTLTYKFLQAELEAERRNQQH